MTEIELKLLLDSKDIPAFRRHAWLKRLAIAKPYQQQLVSVYFDTPDLYLLRHKTSLRVRKIGRTWIQTLKGGGRVEAGLHQHHEWESEVRSANPDLASLSELIGQDGLEWKSILSDQGLADRLMPVFTTRFRRTIWMLRTAQGDEVELALDQGAILCNAAQEPICEIELELKSGDPAHLFDLALELQRTVPLRIGTINKAERGYALYAHRKQGAVKAKRIELSDGMTVERGFQAILGNCLEQIQGNEAGVVQGEPEGVHQMRVGLRRLRVALGLFRAAAPCPAELLDELRWLSGELGAARDWDVFSGDTLASVMDACPEKTELARLQQVAEDMALQDRQKASSAVSSIRFSRLLLSFAGWSQGKRWRDLLAAPDPDKPVAMLKTFADTTLARHHRKLLKRGKNLLNGTSHERHEVRIAAKKVRYSVEFFQSLYSSRQLPAFLEALSILQDKLGQLNDAFVAGTLLRKIAQMHPDMEWSAGFGEGYLAAQSVHHIRKLKKPWQKFKSMRLPVGK